MLTLRAPYLAGDHEATRRLILDARPVRPREHNRTVSWEVETICLAAMDRDPERRYPTALAFAADLLNVLEHRPITARAAGVPLKLRRWSQRHPAATVALLLCVLAVVLGPIVYGVLLAQERDDAIAARNAALRLTKEKELQTYLGNVGAVGYGLRYLRPAEARARLAECSEELRGFEWSHLWLKCDASLAAIPAHEGGVRRVAFAREQELLVSASLDGTVAVWNVATRELVRRFDAGDPAVALAVSPDGKLAAAGAGKTVLLWDLATGAERRFEEHRLPVLAVCFTPDGRLLSGSPDQSIVIRDLASGETKTLAAGAMIASLAVSADGRRLAAGARGPVLIYDLETLARVAEIDAHTQFVFGVAFAAEGQELLTGSQDGSAALWEVGSGRRLLRLADHDADVGDVAFSADGSEIVTASSDSMVRVFDAKTGVLSRTYHGHDLAVYGLAVGRDGRLIASCAGDGTIRLWNAAGPRDQMTLAPHRGPVRQVAASPDSRFVLSSNNDHVLRITEVESGRTLAELAGHEGLVTGGVFDATGQRVWSASEDRTIRAWSCDSHELLSTWACDGWVPRCLVTVPGKVYSGGSDGHVRVWDPATGAVVADFAAHASDVNALAVSADGSRLWSGGADGKLVAIELAGGARRRVAGFPKQVGALALAPGERHVFAAVGSEVQVVDLDSGETVRKLTGHASEVRCVAASPDGRRVATGSMDRMLRIWDAETGVSLLTLHGHREGVQSLVWSPDGAWIASGPVFGSVIVWRR
jgi:WD40 repeat protein